MSLTLDTTMTHVYALQIDAPPDEWVFESLLGNVSNDKRDKIRKFLRMEDALRALFADLLIRYILSRQLGISVADITFEYNEFGKPSCKGIADFHYNISHSGKWIVCATSSAPVGIDIERIAPVDMEVAENSFSKNEREQLFLLTGPEQLSFFYELWTIKESYLKWNGSGLSQLLDSFSVVIDEKGLVAIESEPGLRQSVHIKQYEIAEEYKMAVCASNHGFGEVAFITLQEIVANCISN